MSVPVVYLLGARGDIDQAFAQYEQQRIGLGEQFLEAIDERVQRLQDHPAQWAVVHKDIRAALLQRFPHVIYYRAEPDRIFIIAVQHGRRNWRRWLGRS